MENGKCETEAHAPLVQKMENGKGTHCLSPLLKRRTTRKTDDGDG